MRPTKEQIDEDIVDTAARLFARHGYDQTSVQRVADAVGYSKTGLLHRFPSKDALRAAAFAAAVDRVEHLAQQVADLAPGVARDRAVLEALTDLALSRPGVVALLLAALGAQAPGTVPDDLARIAEGLFRAFGDDPPGGDPAGGGRALRVTLALGGLAVASLACADDPTPAPAAVRAELVAAAHDALGRTAPRPAP